MVNLNLLISFPSLEFFTTHIAVLTISVKSAIRGKLISAWQSPQTLENDFDKKEEMIREMAKTLFEELLKTAEEKKEERGMTAGLITKIIDNLQVSLL